MTASGVAWAMGATALMLSAGWALGVLVNRSIRRG